MTGNRYICDGFGIVLLSFSVFSIFPTVMERCVVLEDLCVFCFFVQKVRRRGVLMICVALIECMFEFAVGDDYCCAL